MKNYKKIENNTRNNPFFACRITSSLSKDSGTDTQEEQGKKTLKGLLFGQSVITVLTTLKQSAESRSRRQSIKKNRLKQKSKMVGKKTMKKL